MVPRSKTSISKMWMPLLALAAVGSANQTAIAQQETYYYKKGEKVTLKVDDSKSYVLLKPEANKEALVQTAKANKGTVRRFEKAKGPTGLNLTADPPANPPKWAIIDNASLTLDQPAVAGEVLYKTPFYLTKDGKQVGTSHLVYVKLKNKEDEGKLKDLAKDLKVEVVGNNKLMPLWYTLACTKDSTGNALQVANKLVESEKFAEAGPDFLADFAIKCAADQHFAKQWGLKNTGAIGAAGIDIGVCDAWKVATGKGVTVAVVDQGIQLDHPDLKANVASKSFDTATGSTSVVRGNHGTACAGIIGAVRDAGNLGVAGVAPDAKLLSVSDSLMLGPDAAQNLATGISWAWQNGADMISNSWGHNLLASPLIDDAIKDALTQGRAGKGCVVVFAAGNSDDAMIYPANDHPDVLAVGAMSPCGQRKSPTSCDGETWWGSCFGNKLDVVAPGVLIPTTDRTGTDGYDSGDYALTFNGTSSATPHIAGIAALILEANPSLTQKEVVTIIEKSGRKVGPYAYSTSSGRPNGDWNQEMGYGLVSAKACVEAAKPANSPKK